MTEKRGIIGRESGKSSTRWFTNSNQGAPKGFIGQHGYGARAGDGRTSDKSILGKIAVVFRPGRERK